MFDRHFQKVNKNWPNREERGKGGGGRRKEDITGKEISMYKNLDIPHRLGREAEETL